LCVGLARNGKSARIRNMGTSNETLAGTLEKMAQRLLLEAKALRGDLEKVAAPEAAEQRAAEGYCLVCNRNDVPLKRGQCSNCRQKTRRRIGTSTAAEAALIRAGKLLPAKPGGGPRDKTFPIPPAAAGAVVSEIEKVRVRKNVPKKGGNDTKPRPSKT
jgi:hypothetical protein